MTSSTSKLSAEVLLGGSPHHLNLYKEIIATTNAESRNFWKYLCMLFMTPRPSGHLDGIQSKLRSIAESLNLECDTDKVGNVVIRKPAGPGFENSPSVCIQSHMDIVASAKDPKFDFKTMPIHAYKDGNWIKAKDTTLGADDGVGVGAALSLLEDDGAFPPIECLFTVDEETDMSGAEKLGAAPFLKSNYTINVDSEENGTICVGSAGGFERTFTLSLTKANANANADVYDPVKYDVVTIEVSGCTGGHSGIDIHKDLANAIKLLARVIDQHYHSFASKCYVLAFNAGTTINALPRAASMSLAVPKEATDEFCNNMQTYFNETIKSEHKHLDPNMNISVSKRSVDCSKDTFFNNTQTMIDLLQTISHGVVRNSSVLKDTVDTSVAFTLANLNAESNEFVCQVFCRSCSNSHMEHEKKKYQAIARAFNCNISKDQCPFPGWEPDYSSKVLNLLKSTYGKLFKDRDELHVVSIHAGLECGFLKARYPNMDIASIGPEILGAHSPDERLNIEGAEEYYKWLTATLKEF